MGNALIASLLVLVCLIGTGLTLLRLPGTWIILLAAVGASAWTGWTRIEPTTLWILAGIAAVGEVIEFGVSTLTAKRAGASRRAMLGSTLGGMIGMILGAPIPPPFVGPIVGALAGAFVGAALGELWKRGRVQQGAKVGVFAAIGFALGIAVKTGLALGMSATVVVSFVGSN